jgi:hypothetical protein
MGEDIMRVVPSQGQVCVKQLIGLDAKMPVQS